MSYSDYEMKVIQSSMNFVRLWKQVIYLLCVMLLGTLWCALSICVLLLTSILWIASLVPTKRSKIARDT